MKCLQLTAELSHLFHVDSGRVAFKTHEDGSEKTRLVLMCCSSLYPLYKQQMVHHVTFY